MSLWLCWTSGQILDRGEKIELLVGKTETLQSQVFYQCWCEYFVRKYVGLTLTENCFVKFATGWHLPQAWQRAEAKDVASEPKVQADGWWRHCSSASHPLADGLQGIQMLDRSKSLLALSLFFLKKKCLCCWPFQMHRMVTESCFSHAVGIGIA